MSVTEVEQQEKEVVDESITELVEQGIIDESQEVEFREEYELQKIVGGEPTKTSFIQTVRNRISTAKPIIDSDTCYATIRKVSVDEDSLVYQISFQRLY